MWTGSNIRKIRLEVEQNGFWMESSCMPSPSSMKNFMLVLCPSQSTNAMTNPSFVRASRTFKKFAISWDQFSDEVGTKQIISSYEPPREEAKNDRRVLVGVPVSFPNLGQLWDNFKIYLINCNWNRFFTVWKMFDSFCQVHHCRVREARFWWKSAGSASMTFVNCFEQPRIISSEGGGWSAMLFKNARMLETSDKRWTFWLLVMWLTFDNGMEDPRMDMMKLRSSLTVKVNLNVDKPSSSNDISSKSIWWLFVWVITFHDDGKFLTSILRIWSNSDTLSVSKNFWFAASFFSTAFWTLNAEVALWDLFFAFFFIRYAGKFGKTDGMASSVKHFLVSLASNWLGLVSLLSLLKSHSWKCKLQTIAFCAGCQFFRGMARIHSALLMSSFGKMWVLMPGGSFELPYPVWQPRIILIDFQTFGHTVRHVWLVLNLWLLSAIRILPT